MMQATWKNNWQGQWITCMLAALLAGLLVSRALVSVASALVWVPFFASKEKWKMAPLAAVFFLLFPIAISFFWSGNKTLWWNSLSVKLPLVSMMMGLQVTRLSAQKRKQIVWLLLLLLCAGCCWSLSQYSYELQEAYLRAKTLPTPMDNDHIRFSWLVSVAILLGLREAVNEPRKIIRAATITLVVFLIVYLHILAAKTGLICLYGGALLFFLVDMVVYKKWKRGLAIALLMALSAFTCYQTMPTLRNRIQYVLYDVKNFTAGNDMPGYNDAARWLSIRAGYAVMKAHPLTGVGAGDVLDAVNNWHNTYHPQSLDYERFLPASEWMVYGAAVGWPGFIFFTAGLIILLYATTGNNAWSWVLSITTLIPILIDDTLEGQYGVVILAFIVFFGQPTLTRSQT